ncbi:hypothetical protein CHS0354_012460 [Potamilus streckersoni]|uniref:Uncharacterized protein n=1 Tax=Potamilus streckersoni TaxID=2493646 RepID=A0AAE0RUS9_9BIVA|nr:hypothetical protein CHS0354_012460 [Potamilus streckersoni]
MGKAKKRNEENQQQQQWQQYRANKNQQQQQHQQQHSLINIEQQVSQRKQQQQKQKHGNGSNSQQRTIEVECTQGKETSQSKDVKKTEIKIRTLPKKKARRKSTNALKKKEVQIQDMEISGKDGDNGEELGTKR